MKTEIKTYGNEELLNLYKIAFFCSRRCPAHIVLKSYDWAIEQRDKGNCIISGFHSKIEKDVLHFLLKGNQPIILALARGLKERYSPEIKSAIDNDKLLIISSFDKSVIRPTSYIAKQRNELMAEIADEIFIAYAIHNGNIEKLVKKNISLKKKMSTFDILENKFLVNEGVEKYSIK